MRLIKQERIYTCGCACMRMVLDHFKMEVPTEEEMIEFLDTDDVSGTRHDNILLSAAQDFNLKTLHGENATIEKIESLHQRGWLVLLLVSVDLPHLVIYGGYNGNHMKIFDPYLGEINIFRTKFESNNKVHPHYRWRAIKSEFADLNGYDFDHLNYNKAYIAFKKRKK